MTRKDYLKLSAALSAGRRMLELHGAGMPMLLGFDNATHTIASGLAQGNPAFDPQRFVADAGAQS